MWLFKKMKIQTLEHYIKKTMKPYGDLLKRAEKTLDIKYNDNGVVDVLEKKSGKTMRLYFENESIYKNNLDNGLMYTEYNYAK